MILGLLNHYLRQQAFVLTLSVAKLCVQGGFVVNQLRIMIIIVIFLDFLIKILQYNIFQTYGKVPHMDTFRTTNAYKASKVRQMKVQAWIQHNSNCTQLSQ